MTPRDIPSDPALTPAQRLEAAIDAAFPAPTALATAPDAAQKVAGERLTASTFEREALFDDEAWDRLRGTGLLGAGFPALPDRERAVSGLSLTEMLGPLERLGLRNPNAGLSFTAATTMASTAVALSKYGSAAQQAAILPAIYSGALIGAHAITESESGSDALGARTRATRDGGEFVIEGEKTFVTNGGIAGVYLVYARTAPGPGPFGLSTFLVREGTPGFEVGRRLESSGLRGSPLSELRFRDCRVPVENLVGPLGGGFLVLDHVMEREIVLSFAVTVGEMRRRLEETIAWCRARRQYGRPIGEYQAVARRVVDMKIGLETSRHALRAAAATLDAGTPGTAEVSIAKVIVSQANLQSSLDAVQVHGGRGFLTEYGVERGVRDALSGTIYSGSNEIQYNRIAAMIGIGT